jgi:hypothetical protein
MRRRTKFFLSNRGRGSEVFIWREPDAGNVILSPGPHSSWKSFLALRDHFEVPGDFMSDRKDEYAQDRELF